MSAAVSRAHPTVKCPRSVWAVGRRNAYVHAYYLSRNFVLIGGHRQRRGVCIRDVREARSL